MRARYFLIFPLLFTACSAGPDPMIDPPPGNDPQYTYERDVAPIIEARCGSCHDDGGIAPFPLQTFEHAASRADQIAVAVLKRTMPPYGVDNSGDCNHYTDARWLTDDELAIISGWASGGAPRGVGPAKLLPADNETAPRAIVPTATIDTGFDYAPSRTRPDDYRCFVVDPQVTEKKYLTGYTVRPGEPRIVHHIILFGLPNEEAEAEILALDAADIAPGYECFGGPGTNNVRFLAGWAPGTLDTRYPARTGIEVPAARKMVMQIHYHALAEASLDRTRIELELVESVEEEAIVLPLAALDLSLPPGQREAHATSEAILDNPPAYAVYGVFPHMHRLGRSLFVSQTKADGSESCMVDVPSWRFEWQQFYFYEEALRVEVGERVNLTCTFDTTSRSEPVTWGEGTDDEMCLAGFYVVRK